MPFQGSGAEQANLLVEHGSFDAGCAGGQRRLSSGLECQQGVDALLCPDRGMVVALGAVTSTRS